MLYAKESGKKECAMDISVRDAVHRQGLLGMDLLTGFAGFAGVSDGRERFWEEVGSRGTIRQPGSARPTDSARFHSDSAPVVCPFLCPRLFLGGGSGHGNPWFCKIPAASAVSSGSLSGNRGKPGELMDAVWQSGVLMTILSFRLSRF